MKRIVLILLAGCLAACSSEPVVLAAPKITDFSGHWEMDYGRSDNVDRKLQSMYRLIVRIVHGTRRHNHCESIE